MKSNQLDALKEKFSEIPIEANAKSMEEVVAYIEEHWKAVRIKIRETEYYAHLKYAQDFMKDIGKNPEGIEDEIRRYALPNKRICLILGMESEYMTSESGIRYYQALTLIKGLTQEDIDTKNNRWLQYMILLEMEQDWDAQEQALKEELERQDLERQTYLNADQTSEESETVAEHE